MRKKANVRRLLSVVLAGALIAGSLVLPGAGVRAEAAKKKSSKKTTTTQTTTVTTVTPEIGTYPVTIAAALISGDTVNITAGTAAVPATDDGIYHLYAQEPNQEGPTAGTEVSQAPAAAAATFAVSGAKANLFKKFVIVGIVGGVPTQLSNAEYISNPEALATHTAARRDTTKKGVLQESSLIDNGMSYTTGLGVTQVTYNLYMGYLWQGGGVNYTYNGKTYSFNASIIQQYDYLIKRMNDHGLSVTLILLNNYQGDPSTIHPYSRDSVVGHNYYQYNTLEDAGVEKLEATAYFLAERYSNNGHGTVDNWVIGNEVNARNEWNYITPGIGIAAATKEYYKGLRIFYNGVKANNANARVYMGTDHEWSIDDSIPKGQHYAGRDYMAYINAYAKQEGNFDYGIATHPYNYDLHFPQIWAQGSYSTHDVNTYYISMLNIDVLTDYLAQPDNLAPDGSVRSVLASEVSYNSHPAYGDEAQQAAATVLGYLEAVGNSHVDGFFPREMDSADEINTQALAFGLLHVDLTPKVAYTWYQSAESAETQAAAAAVIGADLASFITVR